jgi:hypothetical protein
VSKLCVRPKDEFADYILAERKPDQLFRRLRRQGIVVGVRSGTAPPPV